LNDVYKHVGSACYAYPSPVVISKDPYLLDTVGSLVGDLLWALIVLPRRNMRLDVCVFEGNSNFELSNLIIHMLSCN
jgi:predicted membrane-bound spermidine synthase